MVTNFGLHAIHEDTKTAERQQGLHTSFQKRAIADKIQKNVKREVGEKPCRQKHNHTCTEKKSLLGNKKQQCLALHEGYTRRALRIQTRNHAKGSSRGEPSQRHKPSEKCWPAQQ